MKEKERNFTDLKKELSLDELKKLSKTVATDYAESEYCTSYLIFVLRYNITKSCFYRLIEEAIVKNYVSDEMICKMQKKAISNQQAHNLSAGASSVNRYAQLRKKREVYRCKQVATYFAQNPQLSKYEVAEEYNLTVKQLYGLLYNAFVKNVVNNKICKLIEKRSLSYDSSQKTKEFFAKLWEKRAENKKGTLN